jgi:hypothetical protein
MFEGKYRGSFYGRPTGGAMKFVLALGNFDV